MVNRCSGMLLVGLGFILAAPIMGNTQEKSMDDSAKQVVSVAVLEPVAEFLSQAATAFYRDDLRGPDGRDTNALFLTDFADGQDLGPSDLGGPIVLRYDSADCGIELPAGRQFMAGLEGPVVGRTTMILPIEPMTWAETETMVKHMVRLFDNAGWQRSGRPVIERITQDDFTKETGPKWTQIGKWVECNGGPAQVHVMVHHYNSMTGSSFTPPAMLSAPLPDDAPDRFLVEVNFSSIKEVSDKLGELVMARRTSEGLDPSMQKLPASIWLDDPDWRPEGWDGGF